MRAYERLLKYVKFATGSDEECENCPSTEGQKEFAQYLVREMKDMGISNARVDENGYVYGSIPPNCTGESGAKLGFIAHMDTVSDVECRNIAPKVVDNYSGDSLIINQEKNVILPPMPQHKGKTVITTDGTTILGADDKAGIAEIMTAAEILMTHPDLKHNGMCIAFTPDEEIGRGADRFNKEEFGADFAYTVDGGEFGQIEYENFNAINVKVVIKGRSVHPGEAKYGGMKNANTIAMEYDSMIPKNARPEYTEGYEGFYHLMEIRGDVEMAEMRYILRDHDKTGIKLKRAMLEKITEFLNAKYGKDSVSTEFTEAYRNMAEYIEPHMFLIENACRAIEANGGVPEINPIRGGTDGARLSEMGLPCPNLGTGSANHHGRYEYAVAEDMDACAMTIVELVKAE